MNDAIGAPRRAARLLRPAGDTAAPVRAGVTRIGVVLLAGVPLAVLAERAWSHRWMSDDGFRNLRVVDQLFAGHGPVFNAGERVEAITSPLWVWVLVLGDVVLPMRLEWVAVVLGIALTVAGTAAAIGGAATLARQATPCSVLLLPIGALVIAAVPAVWDFASSGLEGGLIFAWLGTCLFFMARRSTASTPGTPWVPWWLAVLAGAGPLVRPDFLLFSLAFVAVFVFTTPAGHRWGPRVRVIAWALAAPMAYEVFRAGYYAALVPNTAFAKEASKARWGQGWNYLVDFVEVYWLWIPFAAVMLGAVLPLGARLWSGKQHRAALVVASFVAGGLLDAVYVVRVGGSHMHGRFLLPTLFAWAAPVAVVPLQRARALSFAAVPWAVVCLLVLRPAAIVDGVQDIRRVYVEGTGVPHPVEVEDHLGNRPRRVWRTPGGPLTLVPGNVGSLAYDVGPSVYVMDLLGLADWFTGRMEVIVPGSIDHEKPLPYGWTLIRLRAAYGDASPPEQLASLGQADWARAGLSALECGKLRELERAVSDDLTVGRFIANIGVAVKLHSVRIPKDTIAAQRKFC